MAKDYYQVLGVDRNATDAEIKKAYRRLAHLYHPDKHKGDREAEERFKEINEAYEVLKDPEKRAGYDRFGQAGVGGGFGDVGFGGDFQDFFGDIFADFFGTRRRRPGPEPGADLRYDLEITFEEAAFGATKKIDIPKTVPCATCNGSGARPGTSPARCSRCNGTGQERFQQGLFSISRTCSACRGTGAVIHTPCKDCGGSGKTRATQTITINIPPGVDTGSRLRIANEGEAGRRGGPPGDLYVFVTVKPHPIFKRDGYDVICEVPVSFPQVALGSEIEVPTLEGPVKLKIPAGTQTGRIFRLKGKGIASLQTGRRGDELVHIRVETPTRLNKRQRELLEEFARISNDDILPQKKSFFEKVREIFE